MNVHSADNVSFTSQDRLGDYDPASTVKAEAENGIIDSIACYVDGGDTHPWLTVGTDPTYGHLDTCLQTLTALVRRRQWQALTAGVATFIELGVGSGEKIAEIVRAKCEAGGSDSVSIAGLDVSALLLRQFRSAMLEIAMAHPLTMNILSARARFDQLNDVIATPHAFRTLRRRTGISAFIMLGNTVANLHLGAFLQTLQACMAAGDLLVISLELGSIDGLLNDRHEMLNHYEALSVRELLSRSLRYLDGAAPLVRACGVENDLRFSALAGTFTIYMRTFLAGRELVTAFANRYDLSVLTRAFASTGLRLELSFALTDTPFYRYLVFRKF